MKFKIKPYKSKSGSWTFLDPLTARTDEENELVCGADAVLDEIEKELDEFYLIFSDKSGGEVNEMKFNLVSADESGSTYKRESDGFEIWLCSVLWDYFIQSPEILYVRPFNSHLGEC